MPVLVEPDHAARESLREALPPGAQVLETTERLDGWLHHRTGEHAVLLGPSLSLEESTTVAERLRRDRPTLSVIFVRRGVDTDTLRQALHAGARDVVAAGDPDALSAALERAREFWNDVHGAAGPDTARVVTVFSPKGGVGKTTAAANLGVALSDRGARSVCLVDLDLAFGDVAITLQLFPSHTVEHAVGGEESLDGAMVQSLLTGHEDGVMVLAAPNTPDARERISGDLITRVLATLRAQFDYLVIDTSPSFDEHTLVALDFADEVLLVATLDVPTLKNVRVSVETLDSLEIAVGHRHLLLNRADDEVGITAEKVESILGMSIEAQVSTAVDIAAATNRGTPITLAQPDHPASRTFRRLAAAVGGLPAPEELQARTERRSRFRIRRTG